MLDMEFMSENPALYPIVQARNLDDPQTITPEDTLRFRSNGYAIPLNFAVKLNLFQTMTLGAGYGREWGTMNNMRSGDYDFVFESNNYTVDRAFGSLGLILYDARKRAKFLSWRYRKFDSNNLYMQSEMRQRIRQSYPWRFMLESEFGTVFIRQNVSENFGTNNEPFFNIALRIEKEYSEYAKVFIKGGAEFRNFIYQPENLEEFNPIKQNLYFVQVGLSISLPSNKRCKVPGCGVVMKHIHDGIEYRGSSIFSPQNRKVGQWY